MQPKSLGDWILHFISIGLTKFFTESTRDWAEDKVDSLKEADAFSHSSEPTTDSDSLQEGEVYIEKEEEEDEISFGSNNRERGLTALRIALKHRLKQYWAIPLLPIIVYLLNPESISLNSIGLYFNFIGAIIVVRGIYRSPSEVAYAGIVQLPNRMEGDPVDRLVAALETIDSIIGSLLLGIGFAIQLWVISGIFVTLAVLLLFILVWLGLR